MANPIPPAITPQTEVRLSTGAVQIRELTWGEHLFAVRKLTDTVMKVLGKDGKITVDSAAITQAIVEQEELVQYLFERSTGWEADKVKSVPTRDALLLLPAIISLNLNDEIVGAAKKVGAQMAGALGLKMRLEQPSTSSSPVTTPSNPSNG